MGLARQWLAQLLVAPALISAAMVFRGAPSVLQRPALISRAAVGAFRMEAFSFDPFDRDVFRILMDAQGEARSLGAGGALGAPSASRSFSVAPLPAMPPLTHPPHLSQPWALITFS
jgi:hypothetical protein